MQSAPPPSATQSRQPTISDMMTGPHQQSHPQPQSIPATAPPAHPYQPTSENMVRSSVPPYLSNSAPSRPSSSGQNYDPIRGSTVESSRPSAPPPAVQPNAPSSSQASPHVNRTSASPSIASLVHPPPAAAHGSASTGYPQQALPQPSIVPSQQSPPPKPANEFSLPPPQASPPIAK